MNKDDAEETEYFLKKECTTWYTGTNLKQLCNTSKSTTIIHKLI